MKGNALYTWQTCIDVFESLITWVYSNPSHSPCIRILPRAHILEPNPRSMDSYISIYISSHLYRIVIYLLLNSLESNPNHYAQSPIITPIVRTVVQSLVAGGENRSAEGFEMVLIEGKKGNQLWIRSCFIFRAAHLATSRNIHMYGMYHKVYKVWGDKSFYKHNWDWWLLTIKWSSNYNLYLKLHLLDTHYPPLRLSEGEVIFVKYAL